MPEIAKPDGHRAGDRFRAALLDLRRAARSLEGEVRHVRAYFASGPRPAGEAGARLPLARVIPSSEHAWLDWAAGVTALAPAFFGDSRRGRWASALLGGGILASAALADQRPSVTRVVPVDAHAALDLLLGAAVLLSPLVLGYAWRDRPSAIAHAAAGATMISTALVTDYRPSRGVGLPASRPLPPPASTDEPIT